MRDLRPVSTLYRIAVLCTVALMAGCSPEQVTLKSKEAGKVQVRTVAVATEAIPQTTVQPASVHAYHRVEIRANTSGFVKTLNTDIGELVQAGDVLAEIDVPEMLMQREVIEARIERLVAEEQQAEALIELAEAAVKSATAKVAEAESLVAGTDASVAAAEAEFSRTQDMVGRGSLQSRVLDEVRMKRDSESANKQAVESATDSARANVAVAKAKKRAAEADMKAAKAATEITKRELEEIDVMIAYGTLKAPFTGLVTQRNIEPGDLVRSASEVGSGKPLFVISQIDKVRVRIPVPESDAALVNPGDSIALTFPSFKAEPPMAATVTRISGSLDPATRTMMIEADMPNPDGKLMPGMFGQALIQMDTTLAANVLPARAIRFDETGKAYVYVVGDDDVVSIADVATGLDDGNSIEVLSGVEPGQRVIDSHLKRFTDGQQVAVLQ
ncbi:Toluene efflux pump periplasmic linker protein TtgG precursor [Planctomycetes bacterium K23_9]|uniref:Toluene efflux pump periplasmic linker protein TtgG n=2 Tax=Stieleria marina TaxID=1930275 RepID=A0A517NZH7_9BACT|nr:Toluene efflux pump periplasmic linker protein TtgG precursor [Planctomycetes bacterium K23_9]